MKSLFNAWHRWVRYLKFRRNLSALRRRLRKVAMQERIRP